MLKEKLNAKKITRAGIIGAIYAALTLALYPISFGAVQVRVSEALCLLPLIFPESILGLGVGCLIANLFGNGALDIVFGTIATLVSAILTYFVGKKIKKVPLKIIVGGIFPVIINAIVIPFTFLAITESFGVYMITALQIFIGQALAVYLVGTPLYLAISRIKKRS
ncbi:MAG: QueT transporter family protein [Clostridiales bacterium]|nr:QueT transporter family protein [Clostridiales bacterium]